MGRVKRGLLLLCVLLVWPAGAQAEPFGEIEREHLRLATKHWGPAPCAKGVLYRVVSLADVLTRTSETFATGYATNERDHGRCEAAIARNPWEGEYTYAERCALLLHEVGHLHGRSHSADPADPMFEDFFSATQRPTICNRGAKRRQKLCLRKRSERAITRCEDRWGVG